MDVHWNEMAIHDLLDSADGPVGVLIQELSERAAVIARGIVQVRTTPTWSDRSTARPPGFTKANISTHLGWNSLGHIYGGINAPADPAIFLEYPAEQYHQRYPFLTTAVWSLEGQL